MIPKIQHKQRRIILIPFSAFLVMFLLLITSVQYIESQEKKLEDRIYPNVIIDGKNIGGKKKTEVTQIYKDKNTKLKNIFINVLYKDTPIASFSAEKLNTHSNGEEIIERAYLIGRTSHAPSRFYQKLTTILKITPYHFNSQIVYEKNAVNEFIATLEEQYNKPAKNALFTFEDGKVVSFREDEKGVKINTQKFITNLDSSISSLNNKIENKTITLSDVQIEPEITLKNSNNLGIEELLAEGSSNYSHSIPERIHNLTLASKKIHGTLIPKNKIFSFNNTVGDISALTGYKEAYIIKNGKTVLGDGGGVCQVSTTLFRTALNAGLPIEERTAHAYRVMYYEQDSKPGFDSTVFSPSVDLKFKNDTGTAVLITMEIDENTNTLKFKFYGKKDGRQVEISPITIYDEQPPPPPLYQDDPTLKKGVTKQIDYPAWGARAYFTYKVKKNNSLHFENKFYSSYKPWQAIYLVGTAD